MKKWHYFVILTLSLLVSFVLYGNSIDGEFVFDDYFFTSRPDLRSLESIPKLFIEPLTEKESGTYRPVSVASFSLNYVFFGDSPVSFHITNIILNGIVAFLVFVLTYQLFKNVPLAVFTALFFAFFPIHTQAVAFIKAREEILAAVFILSAWFIFLKATEEIKIRFELVFSSSLLLLCAFLSKDFAIFAPALFIGVYWIRNKPSFTKLVSVALVLMPALGTYFVLRYLALREYAFTSGNVAFIGNPLVEEGALAQLFTGLKILFLYVGKTFVPINLTATYNYNHLPIVANLFSSWQALVGTGILFLFLYFILNRKTRTSPLGIGAFLFLVSYFIFSQFLFTGGDMVAEHWIYFPSFGLALIGGYLSALMYKTKKYVAVSIFAIILLVFGGVITHRNAVWASDKELAQSMISDAPRSIKGYFNLATVYFEENNLPLSKENALKASSIYDRHAPLVNLLGKIALVEGRYKDAEKLFLRAVELLEYPLKQVSPQYRTNYLLAILKQGRYEESLSSANQLILQYPRDPQLRFAIAVTLYKLGRMDEAREFFDWTSNLTNEQKVRVLEEF